MRAFMAADNMVFWLCLVVRLIKAHGKFVMEQSVRLDFALLLSLFALCYWFADGNYSNLTPSSSSSSSLWICVPMLRWLHPLSIQWVRRFQTALERTSIVFCMWRIHKKRELCTLLSLSLNVDLSVAFFIQFKGRRTSCFLDWFSWNDNWMQNKLRGIISNDIIRIHPQIGWNDKQTIRCLRIKGTSSRRMENK